MVKVTVVGASGYLGGELLRILVNHPEVEEIIPTSRTLAGKSVSTVHRNLLKKFDEKFVDLKSDRIDSDIAFFAAPPGDWFEELPGVLERGVKVITLGGKFRIKDSAIDKEVYGGYENAQLLKERVYGLPEIYRNEIKKARFVTNPGCYATSVILGILPLKKFRDEIDLQKVSVTSVSGTSGWGAEPLASRHHPEMAGNIRPYNTTFHRHTPEIEHILNESFKNIRLSFLPIVADLRRGIVSNATLFSDSANDYAAHYSKYYKEEPFVRVTEEIPEVANVLDSNYCDVHAEYNPLTKRILVISALDNMIKGGAGQAVQNMNLMMKLDEKAGLDMVGGHP
jgi:N-acetyl-gamma-glutamyl-phosphate reductase